MVLHKMCGQDIKLELLHLCLCSFEDRIMIPDPKFRHLIERYVKKGLDDSELADLLRNCQTSKYKFLLGLMIHLEGLSKTSQSRYSTKFYQCPSLWRNFVHSIGSSSPVCALIPPNDKSKALINRLCTEDITKCPEVSLGVSFCQCHLKIHLLQEMKHLQNTLPVVFDLILSLGHYPTYVTPILKEMFLKAKAPFSVHPVPSNTVAVTTNTEDEVKTLSFFPILPILRKRRHYESDCSKKTSICTKKHTGHQSLTPGVFTLYCHHGKFSVEVCV